MKLNTRLNPNGWKPFAAGTLLALASVAVTSAEAAPHGGAGPMMGGAHLERLLERVDASAEQRAQIKQITEAARAETQTQREAAKAVRQQMMALFTQPTVDARAAEALRQQQMAQHDAASRRMLQTMLDISRVLSVEQRQQIAATLAQRRDMMQRHHRERQSLQAPKAGG